MGILLWLPILIIAFLGVLKLLTAAQSRETKLLRRIWRTTALMRRTSLENSTTPIRERDEAIEKLLDLYGFTVPRPDSDTDEVIGAILLAMVDARKFDIDYPNNLGVFIADELGDILKQQLHQNDIVEHDNIIDQLKSLPPPQVLKLVQIRDSIKKSADKLIHALKKDLEHSL